MPGGSFAKKSARINARRSGCWELWEQLSQPEQTILIKLTEKCYASMASYDKMCKAKADAAAATRLFRNHDAVAKKAAQKYADAKVMHGLSLWNLRDVKVNLTGKWIYEQKELLTEQIGIIVDGYGYEHLALKKKKGGAICCDVCGHKYGTGIHELAHFKAIRPLIGPGGLEVPDKPPLPRTTVKSKESAAGAECRPVKEPTVEVPGPCRCPCRQDGGSRGGGHQH